MIKLYTAATPNGQKVSIALEEMGIPYEVHAIDLMANEQKEDWFLKINPNGRIPAIVDTELDDLAVFESGAIMVHLAEKIGSPLLPTEPKARAQVMGWLMFQMGGIGPMMGQANVFFRYFPEKLQPAIDRYQGEVRRLFTVLDDHLKTQDSGFLAGDYSLGDIANWAWVRTHKWSGVETAGLPVLEAWMARIDARPQAQAGVKVPEDLLEKLKMDDDSAEKFAKDAAKMVETGKKG